MNPLEAIEGHWFQTQLLSIPVLPFLLAVVALSRLPNLFEPRYPPWEMGITEAHALKVVEADLRDIMGSVPDHYNKGNSTIKQVTQIFWFPSAYKLCLHYNVAY